MPQHELHQYLERYPLQAPIKMPRSKITTDCSQMGIKKQITHRLLG
jgi:hypothetical protein